MEEDLSHAPLQAILLADSFSTTNTKLEPITLECPKVLLPLVNTPMIDYTLAWLESADVEQVFVLYCAHSKQIMNHIEKSKWVNKPNFSVTTIESHNCTSAGDALRDFIHGDFILVSGDTVSNMKLTYALEEYKERRRKDNNVVITMLIKQSEVGSTSKNELIMAVDPTTKELVYYEDKKEGCHLKFDKSNLTVSPCLSLHNDKQDCYIDICSPQVLTLFTEDNFDYQHLRQHFVKGLLVDDDDLKMGLKIFTHEIHSSCYAARTDNFRSYGAISKDIMQRRCVFSITKPEIQSCSITESQVGPFTYIGKDTKISNSVVGEGCKIGCNVAIDGCFIWNNVTIEDGCKLSHAILCDGAVMKSGAVLEAGVVLSYGVVVGQGFVVRSCSKVSSLLPPQPPVKQDSDTRMEGDMGEDG